MPESYPNSQAAERDAQDAAVGPSRESRVLGAFWGSAIGDALAAPLHGYTNLAAGKRTYGTITDYAEPQKPHPDSILYRTRYESPGPKGEILHERKSLYGRPGIHYHQGLSRGDNTLNLRLAFLLWDSLLEKGGYDQEDYVQRYLDFMLTPGRHKDTWIDEAHRRFFFNYGNGREWQKCAEESDEMGGLVLVLPIAIYLWRDRERAIECALSHLSITHKGVSLRRPAELLCEMMHHLIGGSGIEATIMKRVDRDSYHSLSYPFRRWVEHHEEDQTIVGQELSSSAHVEEGMPGCVYLAFKYRSDFEQGLIASTNLGGGTCERGALLGAMLGAALGCEEIPDRWVLNLADYNELDQLADRIFATIC
jgi:ADP-ribosylglycohydrolase